MFRCQGSFIKQIVALLVKDECYIDKRKFRGFHKRLFFTGIPVYERTSFFQAKPKEHYSKIDEEFRKIPKTKAILDGLQILKQEIKIWQQEIKDKFEADAVMYRRPGDIDMQFTFETDEKRNNFILTCDSDHLEGYSDATFTTTQLGSGLFAGNISTRVPGDGIIKKAGYCNITSIRVKKSFKRDSFYDWTQYTHLVLKVRGDGRTYMINLNCPGSYDIFWNDSFQYVLYTRGGPYWQITKIPFSKFFLGAKGRIQDIQHAVPLTRVSSVGITAADGIEGPFSLEVDYIGLENDPSHTEEFAYEMYEVEKYVAHT